VPELAGVTKNGGFTTPSWLWNDGRTGREEVRLQELLEPWRNGGKVVVPVPLPRNRANNSTTVCKHQIKQRKQRVVRRKHFTNRNVWSQPPAL
jgi:hypothetical protein